MKSPSSVMPSRCPSAVRQPGCRAKGRWQEESRRRPKLAWCLSAMPASPVWPKKDAIPARLHAMTYKPRWL